MVLTKEYRICMPMTVEEVISFIKMVLQTAYRYEKKDI